MDKIQELRQKKNEAITRMRTILDTADKEKREISESETKEYDGLEKSLDALDVNITREERLVKEEAEMRKVVTQAPSPARTFSAPDKKEFRNIGEFAWAIKNNPNEERVQQMKDATTGGYAIPSQFLPSLLSVSPQEAIIKPRAVNIPVGSPPDAEINLPALDQTVARNMYGGITVAHQGESDSYTESTMRIRNITLKPHKLTGYVTLSNELINNWDAASGIVQTQMRLAMIGASETDYYSGDGVNKAQGILNSPARINITRATASQISWADVYGMYARCKLSGGNAPVWIASQTIIPQLVQIMDASSAAIWAPSAAEGIPGSLYGIPVLFNERSPALGSVGDLSLCNLGYYLIKDGSGPTLAVSEHVRFQNGEVAFRLDWRTDGESWLSEPIALEGSTANTISPFVVLN